MENRNSNHRISFIISFILLACIILPACSKTIRFTKSEFIPEARGYVKIGKVKDKKFSIRLRVRNLPGPQKLQPAKSMYVVWMDTENEGVKNIGQLVNSPGLPSNAQEITLKMISSVEPIGFLITAEDSPIGEYPGTQVVLRTRPLK